MSSIECGSLDSWRCHGKPQESGQGSPSPLCSLTRAMLFPALLIISLHPPWMTIGCRLLHPLSRCSTILTSPLPPTSNRLFWGTSATSSHAVTPFKLQFLLSMQSSLSSLALLYLLLRFSPTESSQTISTSSTSTSSWSAPSIFSSSTWTWCRLELVIFCLQSKVKTTAFHIFYQAQRSPPITPQPVATTEVSTFVLAQLVASNNY